MRRSSLLLAAIVAAGAMLLMCGPSAATPTAPQRASAPAAILCSSGYVDAHLSWGDKCLRAGGSCKVGNPEYHPYGFDCPASGHLSYYSPSAATTTTTPAPTTTTTPITTTTPAPTSTSTPTTPTTTAPPSIDLGRIVLLGHRTKTSGCTLGALPDQRCSPGAYYTGLTKAVICSANFRTGPIRNVPESEKHQVEIEYGLAAKGYGSTLEIDHIVSLELGGSNDIANLYPEKATLSAHAPGYHVKDKLENKLHDLVCRGQMTLRSVQRQIAANWEALYRKVFGILPAG